MYAFKEENVQQKILNTLHNYACSVNIKTSKNILQNYACTCVILQTKEHIYKWYMKLYEKVGLLGQSHLV